MKVQGISRAGSTPASMSRGGSTSMGAERQGSDGGSEEEGEKKRGKSHHGLFKGITKKKGKKNEGTMNINCTCFDDIV